MIGINLSSDYENMGINLPLVSPYKAYQILNITDVDSKILKNQKWDVSTSVSK